MIRREVIRLLAGASFGLAATGLASGSQAAPGAWMPQAGQSGPPMNIIFIVICANIARKAFGETAKTGACA